MERRPQLRDDLEANHGRRRTLESGRLDEQEPRVRTQGPAAPGSLSPAEIVPLQATRPVWAAAVPEPVRPRVEVTIGSIEIVGPEPAAPLPPAPAVAHGSVAAATSGFDDFARLRTYASWPR